MNKSWLAFLGFLAIFGLIILWNPVIKIVKIETSKGPVTFELRLLDYIKPFISGRPYANVLLETPRPGSVYDKEFRELESKLDYLYQNDLYAQQIFNKIRDKYGSFQVCLQETRDRYACVRYYISKNDIVPLATLSTSALIFMFPKSTQNETLPGSYVTLRNLLYSGDYITFFEKMYEMCTKNEVYIVPSYAEFFDTISSESSSSSAQSALSMKVLRSMI